MWPKIERNWIESEVGGNGVEFLERLYEHLCGGEPNDGDIEYRLAPSIITRSECEILSLSAPRFAVRARFKNGTFINVRRMSRVAKWGTSWEEPQGQLDTIEFDHETAKIKSPVEVHSLSSKRCLADGLIIPSRNVSKCFQFVDSDLYQAYGEDPPSESIRGIPFVQSITLGGGLCAQAVCFMASCVLSEHAKGIHGLGEISAIVSKVAKSTDNRLLLLGGLNAENIRDYFNSEEVGLSSAVLTTNFLFWPAMAISKWSWFESHTGACVIDFYLRSGMPVVLLVDASKLPEYYGRCGAEIDKSVTDKVTRHAILAVGTFRRNGFKAFLVNDPSYLPLMQISEDELFKARVSTDSHLQFIPVTPKGVELHLLNSELFKSKINENASPGLYTLIANLIVHCKHADCTAHGLCKCFADTCDGPVQMGEFLLVNGEQFLDPVRVREFYGNGVAELISNLPVQKAAWYWIQLRKIGKKRALIVWDASRKSVPCDIQPTYARRFIVSAWIQEDDAEQWILVDSRDADRSGSVASKHMSTVHSDSMTKPIDGDHLRLSVISSFVCTTFEKSCEILKVAYSQISENCVDVYALMQSEKFIPVDVTAEQYLENLYYKDRHRTRVVKKVIQSIEKNELNVSGFATFFPSMSLPANHHLAKRSRMALTTTCLIAQEVCEYFECQSLVEIVGGSRIHGLYPALHKWGEGKDERTEKINVTGLIGWKRAIRNLVRNLLLVRNSLNAKSKPLPRIALELEPGPIFTINGKESLLRLVKLLDKLGESCNSIGLNVDISHYRLAGIDPDFVESNEAIIKRVWHAHLAGHHRSAHFGDISPLTLNSIEDFKPWLRLLTKISRTNLQFSRTIALELEAAHSQKEMMNAIREAHQLLQAANY